MREAALKILLRVEQDKAYSNALLSKTLSEQSLPPKQRGVLYSLVKGTLEWQRRLDFTLKKYIEKNYEKLPPATRVLLRMATYQILFMESSIPAGVVSETVELAKKYGKRGAVGLTNAVLRKMCDNREQLLTVPQDIKKPGEIALWYSHPDWLVKKLVKEIGVAQTIKFCKANNTEWSIDLRVNSLRTDLESLTTLLKEQEIQVSHNLHRQVVKITGLSRAVASITGFERGLFYVQDESSALVSALLDRHKMRNILDMCAAPGGKALSIAQNVDTDVRLLAVDIHRNKVCRIVNSCKRLGLFNIDCIVADSKCLPIQILFDAVILDAPCTGSGVIGRKGDLRWNRSESDLDQLLPLQSELFNAAALAVQPGGFLLYSTCSVLRSENEEQVETFLQKHPDFKVAEPPRDFPKSLISEDGFFRCWPERHRMAGAFAALLTRLT